MVTGWCEGPKPFSSSNFVEYFHLNELKSPKEIYTGTGLLLVLVLFMVAVMVIFLLLFHVEIGIIPGLTIILAIDGGNLLVLVLVLVLLLIEMQNMMWGGALDEAIK